MKKFLIVLLLLVVCIGGLAGYVVWDDMTVEITDYEIASEKLPEDFDGYKIALLTDYHNATYPEQVIDKVKQIEPDVIIACGDMMTMGDDSYANTTRLFDGIVKIAPVYMVSGNHEIFSEDWRSTLRPAFEAQGVKVLDIADVYLTKGSSRIHMYGLQDPAIADSRILTEAGMEPWIQKAVRTKDPDTFNILLCHRANYFDRIYKTGYELVLSGHMHGGMVRLPFLGGLLTPERDQWFPAYTAGIYEKEGSKMVVSRGLDNLKGRPRVFNGPEVVAVTLRTGE